MSPDAATDITPAKTLLVDPEHPAPEQVKEIAEVLQSQELVILPTDTVYGIGMLATEGTSLQKLMVAKQRPSSKSIPLLVASVEALSRYGSELPAYAHHLAAQHWPGALTLVVRASSLVPQAYIADDGTVALRMPRSTLTLSVIEATGSPLACSSANLSGQPPALQADQVNEELVKRVSLIVDGGSVPGGAASTVVSCVQGEPRVLRPGPVTISEG